LVRFYFLPLLQFLQWHFQSSNLGHTLCAHMIMHICVFLVSTSL
jgi:hypothetical protein